MSESPLCPCMCHESGPADLHLDGGRCPCNAGKQRREKKPRRATIQDLIDAYVGRPGKTILNRRAAVAALDQFEAAIRERVAGGIEAHASDYRDAGGFPAPAHPTHTYDLSYLAALKRAAIIARDTDWRENRDG